MSPIIILLGNELSYSLSLISSSARCRNYLAMFPGIKALSLEFDSVSFTPDDTGNKISAQPHSPEQQIVQL